MALSIDVATKTAKLYLTENGWIAPRVWEAAPNQDGSITVVFDPNVFGGNFFLHVTVKEDPSGALRVVTFTQVPRVGFK